MFRPINTTLVTLWVNRFVALIVAILLPALPYILNWYATIRQLSSAEYIAILMAFYCCAAITAVALWNLDKLLRNILEEIVFVRQNVRRIRIVRWCCGGISLICLPAACIYYPLIFMVIIMAFLCLVVSVVVRVMDTAVTIREENDLTI